ncbi:MAG: DUF192 domain-containing protein [Dechloromonas sp.]|jgi:uncharacterized membrane protein (UPF0127 family)|nr:DUF192 domain-containing protein [Dechloromonas sp.]
MICVRESRLAGRCLGLVLAIGLSLTAVAQDAMPVIELSAGFHRIEAEVAAQDRHRQVGLMHRPTMPVQRGMLFVFPQANTHCMWMRNTFIPLSVAFLDEEGRIINIEDMTPHSEDNHCARRPARYALEMNRGWFVQRGITPGSKLRGLERAPAPR